MLMWFPFREDSRRVSLLDIIVKVIWCSGERVFVVGLAVVKTARAILRTMTF